MNRIIEQIKKRMDSVEMSQAEMAEKIHVSPVTIYRYMKGERIPDLEVLEQMAEVVESLYSHASNTNKSSFPTLYALFVSDITAPHITVGS